MKISVPKLILLHFVNAFRLYDLGYYLYVYLKGASFVRVVNYHCTPAEYIDKLESHLTFYQKHYENVTEAELLAYLSGASWNKSRPGLVISFDDGLRSNYDVAASLLEKYGFTGWFMVPAGFAQINENDQKSYSAKHSIWDRSGTGHKRIAMSTDELLDLVERGHTICGHTYDHTRLPPTIDLKHIRREIYDSKLFLETRLGISVNGFAWVGGEECNFSRNASRAIRMAGYKLSFNSNGGTITSETSRFKLGRVNIESYYSLPLVKFQLSWLFSLLYLPKRLRVNKIL